MVRGMRTHSVMDDPSPFRMPDIKEPAKPKKPPESEQQKLRKHPKFPQLAQKIAIMKEKHRLLLPGGTPVEDSERSLKEIGSDWKIATAVLGDLNELELWMQQNLDMTVIDG